MVLWEITLGTAYFLGLKRTYKLILRIQRRLVGPNHPKIRHFLHRRTRAVFDVALKVHRSIQERDIEVGRNLGNRILRCLDRMKPSAQIRGSLEKPHLAGSTSSSMTKQASNAQHQKTQGATIQKSSFKGVDHESKRHLFSSSKYIWHKPFPPITMMMRPPTSAGMTTQYRHMSFWGPEVLRSSCGRAGFEGVIRKDIMQWMLQN